MNIALLGPPGAGKGTHANLLCGRYNLRHISTGDLFRKNLENNSALGAQARQYMERGELVPDEVVDGMIEVQDTTVVKVANKQQGAPPSP